MTARAGYTPSMNEPDGNNGVAIAGRRFLNYVLFPAWMLAGFADYLCHRRSKIQCTSGTHESLTHLLMMASAGTGVVASLIFEENETLLAISAASALLHEAIVVWDFGYAAVLRPPSATEQHVHSFLEVLPFAGFAVLACLNPDDFAALTGAGSRPVRWRLEPKRNPAMPSYTSAALAAATLLVGLPHLEEFIRCYSVDHTLLPHSRPIEDER